VQHHKPNISLHQHHPPSLISHWATCHEAVTATFFIIVTVVSSLSSDPVKGWVVSDRSSEGGAALEAVSASGLVGARLSQTLWPTAPTATRLTVTATVHQVQSRRWPPVLRPGLQTAVVNVVLKWQTEGEVVDCPSCPALVLSAYILVGNCVEKTITSIQFAMFN